MTMQVKVTCDKCGKDITTTGNCENWRLAVINEPIPSRGGVVTLMHAEPVLETNLYFCSWNCIDGYFKEAP